MPSITFELPHAATLNQLNAPTLDGRPDENARENCVPTSIAEGLRMLTGHTYDPDELKDAVYGQGYVGVQSAHAYIGYCFRQHVDLVPVSEPTQAELVARLRHEVAIGHPVGITMPSEWGTAPADPRHPSGYTHAGLAVGIGPDSIRVMNPWGGFWQDESDEWWAARLCFGQIWPMSRHAITPPLMPAAPDIHTAAPSAPSAPVVTPQPQHTTVTAAPALPRPASPNLPLAASQGHSTASSAPKGDTHPMNTPFTLFTLFARAWAGVSLTPGERALLKLAKGIGFTIVVAALGVAMPLISSGHFAFNSATIQAIIGAGAAAGLSALEKLFSAKGDANNAAPPAA